MVLSKLCVWLIDDDSHCIQRVEACVKEYGAEFVLFRHPAELFNVLDEEYEPPDLILLDSDPVVYSTNEICRGIRRSGGTEKSIVFCLCDTYNANVREVDRMVGVDGWILRPIKKESLVQLLDVVQSDVEIGFSEREDIQFDVKLGRLSIGYDGENILCSGTMDENANFDPIVNLLPADLKNSVGIDWSGLRTINVQGLMAWRDFRQSEEAKAHQYLFFRCPVIMLEYFRMMPDLIGENVSIVSINVVIRSHIEIEFVDAFIDSEHQVVMGDTDLSVRRQTKELAYGDYLDCVFDLSNPVRHKDIGVEYLPFLHLNIRNILSEFFLTRHTILDQVSQMAARFSSFDRAARFLGTECQLKPATRSAMIECVFKSYEPILFDLVAAERLLNCLKGKIDPQRNYGGRRRIFSDLLYEFSASGFTKARIALKTNRVGKLEAVYDRTKDLDDLSKLARSVYATICDLVGGLIEVINDIGIGLLKLLASYAEVEPFVFEAAAALEQKEISLAPQGMYRFAHYALHDWEGAINEIGPSIERASCLCLDYDVEMTRIMHSLNSHDEMTQVLEHRMAELKRICEGAEREEIMDRIYDRAVTILEKKIVSFSFEEFRDAFENATETEMEFF